MIGKLMFDFARGNLRRFPTGRFAAGALCAAALFFGARALAQDEPLLTVDNDCSVFAIAPDDTIAYSVTHLKRFDKIVIQRDELWVVSPKKKFKLLIEPDKFMPVPPPESYVIQGITWSPDSQQLALSLLTKTYPWTPKVKGKKKGTLDDDDIDNTYDDNNSQPMSSSNGSVIALLDGDGREIKVERSKSRFIQGALTGTWLADGKTFVYLNGSGQIVRVKPDDGETSTLYDEKHFQAVAWDAPRNRAFAVGEGLTGRLTLVELGLLEETVSEITRIDQFEGNTLVVSSLGDEVGYFRDGDTIETRSIANPAKVQRVHTGPGRFEFDHDDRRILIKRGAPDKSYDLVWVRLSDGDFSPILHDLVYHDFHIAPDGNSIGVIEVGRGLLKVYPLEQ
jgi:hypothetical protein